MNRSWLFQASWKQVVHQTKMTVVFQIYDKTCVTIRKEQIILHFLSKSNSRNTPETIKMKKNFAFIKAMNILAKIISIKIFRTLEIDKGLHQPTEHLLEKVAAPQKEQWGWWFPSLHSCIEALDHQLCDLTSSENHHPSDLRVGKNLFKTPPRSHPQKIITI